MSTLEETDPLRKAVICISDISWRKKIQAEREQLIDQLQTALAEIRTLRGILPLCSNGKKIRNDEGYWEQVDVNIDRHSKADVSHGICPDCAGKRCPQYLREKKR